tara:strand:+ start:8245 stop:9279 length:1035 start_codon:yes stop_codon:yes gene_type:complete
MNSSKIEEVLTSLGYKLTDRGSYWQTSAIYRNGDNNTALQIYKDTGVWKDYVEQTPYMTFEKLLKVTLKTNDEEVIGNYIKEEDPFEFTNLKSTEKITMEKTYPESCLDRLLPHYKFYNDRNISSSTLKLFKGGYATEGKMLKRFVFPIYNLDDKIHGFSGRDMTNSSQRPKWKHIGIKSKWIYPHKLSRESIDSEGEVFLVESIGDVLSLFENNHRNVLCTFGLEISPSLISYIVGLNPSKIYISFNNDSKSENNAGLISALKNFIKLQSFFDNEKIFIHLPTKNDFGEMNFDDISDWHKNRLNIEKNHHDFTIINNISKILEKKSYPEVFLKKFKKFKKNHG